MAYFRKVKNGWRAEIRRKGLPGRSITLPTKAQAQAWAAQQEADIAAGKLGQYPAKTVAEAFRRYELEVSKKKRGGKAEALRFEAFIRDFPLLAGKIFHEVTTADLAMWRDERLKHVGGSSVLRELAQLRNVWTVARKEWLWCGDSPWTALTLPPKGKPRKTIARWKQMRRILRRLNYRRGVAPTKPKEEVAYAWLIAHYTALRASEVLSLSRSTVNLEKRTIFLEEHKTVEDVGERLIPFFPRVLPLLQVLDDAARAAGRDKYFTLSAHSLDQRFRHYRDSVLIEGLQFRDSRAAALTWMSRRIDVLTLAKISGHKDLRMLIEHYYRETPEQISARL
ncbi:MULTISPECIES: tyrosine-type recombinase/integrase [Brachymonas]|uniref:tyrosine-type recombinase/integrase n=1 Tax=Brachymonas TaxID=28219 RepID=UPI002E776B5E|nr:tyrosine-type recombinase/integrase [Brachymonas sp. J145]MEE1653776.1 tyrosine-type recombinase/integrase [Brachymonas sp. J145]